MHFSRSTSMRKVMATPSARDLQEPLVAVLDSRAPGGVGLDRSSDARPASRVRHGGLLLETRSHASEPCRTERAALWHGDAVDRYVGRVGDRLHPLVDADAATGGDEAPRLDP